MKFSYKHYPNPNGIAIERRVIFITLRNPRAPSSPGIRYEALVDSGSDRCIFSAEIGELLGIDITATDKVLYVGGVVAGQRRPIYVHPVEIKIGDGSAPTFVADVGFMPDFSKSGHGRGPPDIAGRNEWRRLGALMQFLFETDPLQKAVHLVNSLGPGGG